MTFNSSVWHRYKTPPASFLSLVCSIKAFTKKRGPLRLGYFQPWVKISLRPNFLSFNCYVQDSV